MRSQRQTAVIITVEHNEVHLLKNALGTLLALVPAGMSADSFDQAGLVRALVEMLDVER